MKRISCFSIFATVGSYAKTIAPRKLYAVIFFLFILFELSLTSCNNDTEKSQPSEVPVSNDTVNTVGGNAIDSGPPRASLAYAYKNKMRKGDYQNIQVFVQLNRPLKELESELQNVVHEQEATEIATADTSIVKSLLIAGYKFLSVRIKKYDTTVFRIEQIHSAEEQELKYTFINNWTWRVTAKKAVPKSDIVIILQSKDAADKIHQEDIRIIPIQITVRHSSLFARYGWLVIAVLLITTGGWLVVNRVKKNRIRERNSRIYFSYAWQHSTDTIVDKLYNSLKAAGFNVIRDKVNLEYKGLISGFMKDIGKGNIIIVSISDKYLRSKFCMFELYEIYRNCGMNKDAFVKKIFPIREEEINLADAAVIDNYIEYWKAEELELEAIVKDKSRETTSEQFAQYEAVKRIRAELGNLLNFLSDINSLNITLLLNDDFAEIKKSLRSTIKKLNEPD